MYGYILYNVLLCIKISRLRSSCGTKYDFVSSVRIIYHVFDVIIRYRFSFVEICTQNRPIVIISRYAAHNDNFVVYETKNVCFNLQAFLQEFEKYEQNRDEDGPTTPKFPVVQEPVQLRKSHSLKPNRGNSRSNTIHVVQTPSSESNTQ